MCCGTVHSLGYHPVPWVLIEMDSSAVMCTLVRNVASCALHRPADALLPYLVMVDCHMMQCVATKLSVVMQCVTSPIGEHDVINDVMC